MIIPAFKEDGGGFSGAVMDPFADDEEPEEAKSDSDSESDGEDFGEAPKKKPAGEGEGEGGEDEGAKEGGEGAMEVEGGKAEGEGEEASEKQAEDSEVMVLWRSEKFANAMDEKVQTKLAAAKSFDLEAERERLNELSRQLEQAQEAANEAFIGSHKIAEDAATDDPSKKVRSLDMAQWHRPTVPLSHSPIFSPYAPTPFPTLSSIASFPTSPPSASFLGCTFHGRGACGAVSTGARSSSSPTTF